METIPLRPPAAAPPTHRLHTTRPCTTSKLHVTRHRNQRSTLQHQPLISTLSISSSSKLDSALSTPPIISLTPKLIPHNVILIFLGFLVFRFRIGRVSPLLSYQVSYSFFFFFFFDTQTLDRTGMAWHTHTSGQGSPTAQ